MGEDSRRESRKVKNIFVKLRFPSDVLYVVCLGTEAARQEAQVHVFSDASCVCSM